MQVLLQRVKQYCKHFPLVLVTVSNNIVLDASSGSKGPNPLKRKRSTEDTGSWTDKVEFFYFF